MALICVIDDDISVREAVTDLLRTVGWPVEAFASAKEFLARGRTLEPSCLLVDVGLPDLDGFDLRDRLSGLGECIPIIFMTGKDDLPTALRARQAGAVQLLVKPFEERELLEGIGRAHGAVIPWYNGAVAPPAADSFSYSPARSRTSRHGTRCSMRDTPASTPAPTLDPSRLDIDAIPGMLWTTLPDGQVDFLNQRWLDYTGLSMEQAAGWGWTAAVWPDDLPGLVAYWKSLLESGRPGEVEGRIRRHDGVSRWCLFRTEPVRDEHGTVVKWYGQTIDIEDRRRAEDAARRQAAHLDELFELAPHAVVLVDDGGRVMRINQEFVRMFGYTPDEAVGHTLEELVAPEERLPEVRNNRRLLSTGRKVEMETVRRRKDGVRLAVSIAASPVLTAGPIEGYIIYRDITARKRDEALLAEEKQVLTLIARGEPLARILDAICRLAEQHSPGVVCTVLLLDSAGGRLRHGAAPSLPPGYTPAEGWPATPDVGPCGMAVNRREPVWVPDLQREDMSAGFRAAAKANGLRACWSIPLLSLDRRVLGTFALYFIEPREPTVEEHALVDRISSLAGIAIERTQVEDALRRSEALLAEAQRRSHIGSFSWKPATGEVTWSEETYQIYGFPLTFRPARELVRERTHPADLPLLDEIVRRALKEGGDLEFEYRLRLSDGAVKHLQVVAHEGEKDGGPRQYIGTVMDVTERRRAQEALERAQLELAHVSRVTTVGQLTASIAHEINQPLAGIVLNANACLRWLEGDAPTIQGAEEAARRILRDAQRAKDVIGRLRSLFQRAAADKELLPVNDLVKEVIALARAQLRTAGVQLRTDLRDDLPPVIGDRVQLQQLLLNLLLNASEAMSATDDRARDLAVRTERDDGGGVRVSVRDSGVGLAADQLERIFEPFYSTKRDGMGMGLAISRSIVENHGGRLWASLNDGPGATFAFTLPAPA